MNEPEVMQSLGGSGTDVEVVVSGLVLLVVAAVKAFWREALSVLDLSAAMKGAC